MTRPRGAARTTPAAISGYTAGQLQTIYHTTDSVVSGKVPTIAVIDAYNYPNAASDLAQYRSTMALSACTVASGCLSIVNQSLDTSPLPASPPVNDDWTVEDALDLDMASAICPQCHLMLVEANDDQGDGLFVGAVNAASVAHYISMSWGGPDDGSTPAGTFAIAGTTYTAATGDNGFEATADVPSTLTDVVSVGGVSLSSPDATATVWSGTGSSCSGRVRTPTPQGLLSTGCSFKAASDLSAIADPNTGVAVNDTSGGNGGWLQVGGTSAASPIVAAMYALSGNHTDPWAPYKQIGTYPGLVADVTSGSNGTCGTVLCNAGSGWDGPTGLGMPLSPEAVGLPLASMTIKAGTLDGKNRRHLETLIPLPTKVLDTAGTPQPLATATASVTGLPAGLKAHVTGGSLQISGTPTAAGSGKAEVNLSGTTPAGRSTSGAVKLPWTITKATFVAASSVKIVGTIKHGHTVSVVLPTLRADSAHGTVVVPQWKVTWFLRGKTVHTGSTYHLGAGTTGARLTARAQATHSGFATRTFTSATLTVR